MDKYSPADDGYRQSLSTYSKIDDETFACEDSKADTGGDTPSDVWEKCYHSIAVANAVLDRIPYFEENGMKDKVQAQKGEALLIRAYGHFVLANMFCQAYRGPEISKTQQGIPYMTKSEDKVLVQYERSDLATVYDLIEKDLLEGLPLIDDSSYEVPKYHFNKNAANAFAARFFLYKRDYKNVVKYATVALGGEGGNPATMMNDIWSKDFTSGTNITQYYVNVTQQRNFMLLPTYSVFNRRLGGQRYTLNREGASATFYGPGPVWTNYNFHPCYSGKLYLRGSQEYGVFFPKSGELFEYTDKVAGIGYAHVVRCEFTAEETLLCRAEAKIFMGDITGGVADLKIWTDARAKTTTTAVLPDLTKENIIAFYQTKDPGYGIVKPLNIEKVFPGAEYQMTDEMIPYLQCALHFRRIETCFDGYRWFDIKRFGIEITHKIGMNRVETLTWDDPRRALQIPSEVISAGLAPTDRALLNPNSDDIVKANISYKK